MNTLQLMKKEKIYIVFFFLLSLFSIALVHYGVLIIQDILFDTKNYLQLIPFPNIFIFSSGLALNFVVFEWLAKSIEENSKQHFDNLANMTIY